MASSRLIGYRRPTGAFFEISRSLLYRRRPVCFRSCRLLLPQHYRRTTRQRSPSSPHASGAASGEGGRAFDRQYLFFYILAGGWLLGTQIADLYNGIAIFNRMKGTARVVFFIFDFMARAVLYKQQDA